MKGRASATRPGRPPPLSNREGPLSSLAREHVANALLPETDVLPAAGFSAIASTAHKLNSSALPTQIQASIPFPKGRMHGQKVALHLERLWDRNISIATRLVDTVTIPMLFKSVGSHKIDPKRLKLDSILDAMTTSGTRPKQKRSR